MNNNVPRPLPVDTDGTFDSRYWLRDDPMAQGPKGDKGDKGDIGNAGPTGPEGRGITVRWRVATTGSLPSSGVSIGDGALVGSSAPYTLYIYLNNPSPVWVSAGTVTIGAKGDKGDKGDTGNTGPQPPLAGSGSATTAAKSDHNHDGTYAVKSLEGRIDQIHTTGDGGGTSAPIPGVSPKIIMFYSGVEVRSSTPDRINVGVDFTAVAPKVHTHAGSDIIGAISVDSVPAIPAAKITSGTFAEPLIPNLSANKITSGTLGKDRVPRLTLNEMFPTNKPMTGTGSLRVAPGNAHSVIKTLTSGTAVHDTGMRQNTDEWWRYVYVPSWGFGWLQEGVLS